MAPSTPSGDREARPRLIVIDGPGKGRSYTLTDAVFTVGRQEGSDLQILTAAVSRRHCEIHRREDGYELVDVGSARGTFVNSLPVGRHTLAHGDFLQISTTSLVFLHENRGRCVDGGAGRITGGQHRGGETEGWGVFSEAGPRLRHHPRFGGGEPCHAAPADLHRPRRRRRLHRVFAGRVRHRQRAGDAGLHRASPRADGPFCGGQLRHPVGDAAGK